MLRRATRRLALAAGAALVLPALATSAHAQTGSAASAPLQLADSAVRASTTTIGGASVLPTTKTVAHWFGTATNPDNGITYGFNMVGTDPATDPTTTTVATDIVPVTVVVNGTTFDAASVLTPTLDSPVFAVNDYSRTKWVTSAKGGYASGGALSAGNSGVQLEDATMRSQFNQTGSSPYHLVLQPKVQQGITITVPSNEGTTIQTPRGVVAADVNIEWWAAQIQNLNASLGFIDPTHLPIYLTNNVMLYIGTNPYNCCVIGFHGAGETPGSGSSSTNGSGDQAVQTYAWASWMTPGFFNPSSAWTLQDVNALSHEIAEWADDPFTNNTVQPWLTPTAPQYGCSGLLETGDPVVGIGFTMGSNTFEQGPTPNGTQVADGYYHPEDEVFMPWFMRLDPNTVSQPVQHGSTGRYTLMGNLNPYPGFKVPATGC